MEIEIGSTRSHCVENSFLKRLLTRRKTDNGKCSVCYTAYVSILRKWFLSELRERVLEKIIVQQQDGARAYYAVLSIEYIND